VESLRDLLDAVIARDKEQPNKPAMAAADQIKYIEDLKPGFKHSIRFLELGSDSDATGSETRWVNCYEWAFGLYREEKYWNQVARVSNVHANGAFIETLIDKKIPRMSTPQEGGLVVYRRNETAILCHVAIVHGSLVHSKWGPGGCVWEHALEEVPKSYGSVDSYFKPPDKEQVLEAFCQLSGYEAVTLYWAADRDK
jgi:hypothetical protein